jgi:pimeloyl-ACP methyl ester carboxylesterase
MNNIRIYGNSPHKVAVIHGGPGAQGDMAPVAKGLKDEFGVLEPLQTKDSVNGQVDELYEQLSKFDPPFVLIGHSWGAWLAWMFAAKYPKITSHIILIGSGAFEESYTKGLMEKRLERLRDDDRHNAISIINKMSESGLSDSEFSEFGKLMTKADSYCMTDSIYDEDPLPLTPDIFFKVWPEAAELRRSGELIKMADKIRCKITFIHGKDDPSPYEGVQDVLNDYGVDFEFILYDKCGHTPWKEKYCAENFFKMLKVLVGENF